MGAAAGGEESGATRAGDEKGVDARLVDTRLAERIRLVLFGSPVARAFGVVLETLAVDRAVAVLPFKPENVTVGDIVHGGVIAAVIDIAGVAAALSGATVEGLRGSATSQLSISYLAPAEAVALRAEAVVLRRGRRQAVVDVSVLAETGLVAKALVTVALF
ncbi:uncharacterized domain 1-containing protein [Rhizobiales bacterium GAS191]|jgi:uncharacterized protein (TIGR00369 family)|nr:uncharacterized domain 1-containing protein [Rhizobiales bacterium GAS113]SEC47479.1 uncharacterized domain 1-containing protein [Rhizobiales bacterium GAS191]SEC78858.1 uncharacterized domain 1-containing protein [Rhizobiales bacterium GAS188]